MSKRNKLKKFEEMAFFSNVRQCPDPTKPQLYHQNEPSEALKGKWSTAFFDNDHPLILELACGKGEYTLGLARRYPEHNIVGVDVKGARIWRGAKTAIEEEINNAGFLRTRIEVLHALFDKNELSEIWITFPDPFPSKENRRLVSPRFLDMFRLLLKENGILHLKTDDTDYFNYAEKQLARHPSFNITACNRDIYATEDIPEILEIKTFYEKQHLKAGKTIKYLKAMKY
ncbi:MAG TPA: tRNA (guanosine(46)-N7)-methyltransferase TrmB [Saprospiraceae bacterium]|nr:tRNA (guanosine(46)-N7)-methyltransferase TrmB [Saprospiraceae bacterium]